MKIFQCIYLALFFCFGGLNHSIHAHKQSEHPIDISGYILAHLGDAYEWHITTWNQQHISIALPILVYSTHSGWHCFSSRELIHATEEGKSYRGFVLSPKYHHKIYEQLPNGTLERPYDFSLTKNVVHLWLVVLILLGILLRAARWYKQHDYRKHAPKGLTGALEMLIITINEEVIKTAIGEKKYKRFSPYLLTVFFFILINNLLGLVPMFPGGSNLTGNINVTFLLALGTFLVINIFANKHYWKEIFWPEVPLWLKIPPIMPAIELVGIFTKPIALMIRLFANIMAGHAVLLSFTFIIFVTWQINTGIGSVFSVFSLLLMIFLNALELFVAFLQAYVFTLLSATFIGLAVTEHHESQSSKQK